MVDLNAPLCLSIASTHPESCTLFRSLGMDFQLRKFRLQFSHCVLHFRRRRRFAEDSLKNSGLNYTHNHEDSENSGPVGGATFGECPLCLSDLQNSQYDFFYSHSHDSITSSTTLQQINCP